MTTIACPDNNWMYSFCGSAPSRESQVIKGKEITFENKSKVKVSIDTFSEGEDIILYDYFEDGVSISDDNMIIVTFRATSPPSFFKQFAIYIEDCNGVSATYSLDNDMSGKENIILTKALVMDNEDFNAQYITKIGFVIKSPKKDTTFTFTISDYHTVYRVQPTYADPQEVIELLGMVDNKGNPFVLTDYSVPSYNQVAKRICEAEEFIENTCRQAWVERRIVGEIRNADSVWATSFGYLGILAQDSVETGTQMFFKGIPVKLTRDTIQTIDYSKGDKVEVRRYGSEWTVVPNGAIWCDESKGIIYIKTIFFQKDASVRVTYRYGKGPCPQDIKQACLLKTAMLIVGTDWYRQRFPQAPGFDPLKQETLNQWVWTIKDILRTYSSVITCGSM